MSNTTMTPVQILKECLHESEGDFEAALLAVEHILSIQEKKPKPKAISAAFAYDIKNKRAQGILNRSLESARDLRVTARDSVEEAFNHSGAARGRMILDAVEHYRRKFTDLLAQTQLASVLEGSRTVAARVPVLDSDMAQVGDIPQPNLSSKHGPHAELISKSASGLAIKNILSSEGYTALDLATKTKATAVAGVGAKEVLTRIRDTIYSNEGEGDEEAVRQEVLRAVDQTLSEANQEFILRANIQSAFSDGQMNVLNNPLVRDRFPYSTYNSIHDDRVRDEHNALDDLGIQGTNIYRNDDPVFQTFRPPWDWNCRCSWKPITLQEAANAGIEEAKQWLNSGIPPTDPTYVELPPFEPPAEFQRDAPLSIKLSILPMPMINTAQTHNSSGLFFPPKESAKESYPRNNMKQFIPPEDIVNAATNSVKLNELKDSIPDSEKIKLDSAINCLHNGGVVYHPSSRPELGIDLYGNIPDPEWNYYAFRKRQYEDWVTRSEARAERRGKAKELLKGIRRSTPIPQDEIDKLLDQAGVDEAEMRAISRMRYRVKKERATQDMLEELYENVIEAIHQRIDEETKSDSQIDEPEEPTVHINSPFGMAFGMTFGMVGDEWHGPTPPSYGKWAPIQPGPRGGKRWKQIGGESGRQRQQFGVKGRGQPNVSVYDEASRRVESETGRPSSKEVSRDGQDTDKPAGEQTTRDTQTRDKSAAKSTTSRESINRINKLFKRYANYFRNSGYKDAGDWVELLLDHINQVGISSALRSLGEERTTDSIENVQYKGTGYFEEPDKWTNFLQKYLNDVGITLQTGNLRDETTRVIASAPVIKPRREGDIVARDTNILTKLEESKLLPGLESSEDIHKVVGHQVTQFTPDVMRKLDDTYGKGKWIVKSYGDEAYAGFGVFFPQRLAEIKASAKQTIWNTNTELKKYGYSLYRDDQGNVAGVKNNATGEAYSFTGPEYTNIPNKRVKKLGNIAFAAAPSEKGARLPSTPEDSLRQDYGITLVKNDVGKVVGVTYEDGSYIARDTPKWARLEKWDSEEASYTLERAITAAESGDTGDAKFMVQPAFKSVGVTQADRAMGVTWETGHEGRVHVTTRNGKASVIPYATLAHRSDAFPTVFYNKDVRDMERAVQDAIDALPPSERAGQTYAPDVMKTKDGWRVVELNASSEFGQSLWLEENPFVIDAFVSHTLGRDPAHVRFMRNVVMDRAIDTGFLSRKKAKPKEEVKPKTPQLQPAAPQTQPPTEPVVKKGAEVSVPTPDAVMSVDAQGLEHAPAGSSKGGQFVSKGQGTEEGTTAKKPTKTKQVLRIGKFALVKHEEQKDVVRGQENDPGEPPDEGKRYVSLEYHKKTVKKALDKLKRANAPSEEDIKKAEEGIAEKGVWKYRKDHLVGSVHNRRSRRNKLLKEFGDGEKAPCVYCGVIVTHGTLEQDKLYTTAQGGRYKMDNIIPSCSDCNKKRGDMSFEEAMEKVVRYVDERQPTT